MLTALLTAAALLIWPARRPIERLLPRRRRKFVVPQLLPLIAVSVLAGPGVFIAAIILTVAIHRVMRTRAAQRDQLTATEALTAGLTGVVDELRAGAHPATAAANAAKDCPELAAGVLQAIAATARLGGDVRHTLTVHKQLRQLAKAWHVSATHGVALADVLDAARTDLARRTAFARQTEAKMAGPRASAGVLAVLPVFGLLLGQLSGADPVSVLVGTTPGQVLLVLGAVLTAAGLLWTTRLTSRAVTP